MKTLCGRWPHYKIIPGIFCLCLLTICCKPATKQEVVQSQSTPVEGWIYFDQLPTEFKEFYKKFHEDSAFQVEHISFPLKGLPDNADPEDMKENDFYYTQDQWILHKEFSGNKDLYSTIYIVAADILVEEHVIDKKTGLMIIRRFAKTSSGWRLIYYAGVNKYIQKETK